MKPRSLLSAIAIGLALLSFVSVARFGVSAATSITTAPVAVPIVQSTTTFTDTAVYRSKRAGFTVTATGLAPLRYQWRRDGQDLAGQTNKTLTIAAAQPTDEGDYTVEVSNLAGAVVSPPARLWVVPPATEFQKYNFTNASNVRLPYFVHLPSDYDPSWKYPLLVVTHGSGWHEGLLPAGFWEYPQVLVFASYAQQTRDPVILVYPTHRSEMGGSAWSLSEADLIAGLMDQLLAQLPVDTDRVYLMSVTVSFNVAVRVATLRRDHLAAAAVAYGYVPPDPLLKGLPLWIFYSLQEGTAATRFVSELRALGSHPLHTEFKTGDRMDVYYSMSPSPAVVDWMLAQRRGEENLGSPTLTIDRPNSGLLRRTGAASIEVAGKANALSQPVLNVGWQNLTLSQRGAAEGRESFLASAIPLAPDQTNVIVISATINAAFGRSFGAATTFADTFPVFSAPVRLGLTFQGSEQRLNWTGGMPPFLVQHAPSVDAVLWTDLVKDVAPPIAIPTQAGMEFYRVVGQ